MKPDHIIIHETDLPYGDAEGIRRYHTEHRGWLDIGYHFVILNGRRDRDAPYHPALDGAVELGRDLDGDGLVLEEEGAHALGYNRRSIGVVYVGRRGTITERQVRALHGLVAGLCMELAIPVERVIGHYETEHEQAKPRRHPDPSQRRKTCPDLDMEVFRRNVREAIQIISHAELARAQAKLGEVAEI